MNMLLISLIGVVLALLPPTAAHASGCLVIYGGTGTDLYGDARRATGYAIHKNCRWADDAAYEECLNQAEGNPHLCQRILQTTHGCGFVSIGRIAGGGARLGFGNSKREAV